MQTKFDQLMALREERLYKRNFARGPCPRCGGKIKRGVALKWRGLRGAGHVCAADDCPWAVFFEIRKDYGGGWCVAIVGTPISAHYFDEARELLPAEGVTPCSA